MSWGQELHCDSKNDEDCREDKSVAGNVGLEAGPGVGECLIM